MNTGVIGEAVTQIWTPLEPELELEDGVTSWGLGAARRRELRFRALALTLHLR